MAYQGTSVDLVRRPIFRPVTIGSYLRDGAFNGSAWVVPPLAPGISQNLQGIYTFETVFNVPGVDPRGVFVAGFRFAVDNQLIGISVNRQDVYVPQYDRSAEEFETWNELDNFGHGLFHSGINVIEYRFHGYERGLRVNTKAVPEPSSLLMLTAGFVGIAVRRRFVPTEPIV